MDVGELVLSRKLGEGVQIDGPAEVELHKLQGNKVQLKITAPHSTKILRTELVEQDAGNSYPQTLDE